MNNDGSFDDRARGKPLVGMLALHTLGWTACWWIACWAIAVCLGFKVSVVWLGVALVPMLGAPAWTAIANWSRLSPRDREDYGDAWREGASGAALAIGPLALAANLLPLEPWLPKVAPADLLIAGALILLFLQILGFWTILMRGRSRRTSGDNLQ